MIPFTKFDFTNAGQSTQAGIEQQRARVVRLKEALAKSKTEEPKKLLSVADYLVKMALNFFGENGAIFNSIAEHASFKLKTKDQEEFQDLEFPKPVESMIQAIQYFVRKVRSAEPFEGILNAETARGAQEILEAAFKSIAENREVSLPL